MGHFNDLPNEVVRLIASMVFVWTNDLFYRGTPLIDCKLPPFRHSKMFSMSISVWSFRLINQKTNGAVKRMLTSEGCEAKELFRFRPQYFLVKDGGLL